MNLHFLLIAALERNWTPTTRGVNPYEKSCDFYKLYCVHSYSTREAKVDKSCPPFLLISNENIVEQSKESMLQNNIYT